jgi:hypothetical protein
MSLRKLRARVFLDIFGKFRHFGHFWNIWPFLENLDIFGIFRILGILGNFEKKNIFYFLKGWKILEKKNFTTALECPCP